MTVERWTASDTLSLMAKGKKTSSDVQRIIVRLSALLSKQDISIYTGLSRRSVKWILDHFEKTGTIPDKEKERRRRSRVLRDEDVNVSMLSYYLVHFAVADQLVSIRNHSRDSWLLSRRITRPSGSELWYPCFKVNNLANSEGWRTHNEESAVLHSHFDVSHWLVLI